MPDLAIALYGQGPSFDPKAGPLTALVEVAGGTDCYLVDRERGRARLARMPGPEAEAWLSPAGVLLVGRLGWWGCSIRLDRVISPREGPEEIERGGGAGSKVPFLPRDLASCPRCGKLVVLSRAREGPGFRLVTPTRRLAARATEVLTGAGLFGFVAACSGVGRKARRGHELDCYGMPWAEPFREPRARRKRGRPRVEKLPRVECPPGVQRYHRKPKPPAV